LVVSSFNCIEPGTIAVNANIKQVYTKIAGRGFELNIVALDVHGGIKANYNKTVSVEIINLLDNAIVASDLSFEFTAADNGRKAYSINLSQAYQNLACKVSSTLGSSDTINSIVTTSSDSFSVRPSSFSSISSSMNNPTSAVGVTTKAGADFFSITASTGVTSYTGTPKYNNLLKDHNDSEQKNKLSGNFSAANEPSLDARGTNFQYKEVGLLKFAVNDIYDDSFTAIDQVNDCTDDFSNVLVNGKYGCKFGNVDELVIGRFVPDRFEVTAHTDGTFENSCVTGGFTYIGEAFTYNAAPSLTVTAYNGEGDITQNYTGDYNKLSDVDFVIASPAADKIQKGHDNSTNVQLSWDPNVTPTLADNGDGSLTFTLGDDQYTYTHEANSIIAAFIPKVELNFTAITDSDGVITKQDSPLIQLSTDSPYTLTPTESELRFGRLNIDNSHGPELVSLSSPVYTEYFNGSSFVTNTEDSCTAINLSQFSFNSGVNPIAVASGSSTASIVNTPIAAGQIGLAFTPPCADNTGSIDINVDNLFEWLKFDWDGDGNNDNSPTARATFGIYKGNQKQIYFREVY